MKSEELAVSSMKLINKDITCLGMVEETDIFNSELLALFSNDNDEFRVEGTITKPIDKLYLYVDRDIDIFKKEVNNKRTIMFDAQFLCKFTINEIANYHIIDFTNPVSFHNCTWKNYDEALKCWIIKRCELIIPYHSYIYNHKASESDIDRLMQFGKSFL